jgi:AbrB family looped-hinge helix DNA binding protein
MPIARSKLTAQGQISVPVEVRKKLAIGPGSVIEWDEKDDEVVVRRAGQATSLDVHRSLFPDGASEVKRPSTVQEGIREYVRRKHARR